MVDQGYILNCSSLSFHKSLVGIMHVDEIETIAKEKNAPQLLSARAFYSYYSVYHLFCSCILLFSLKHPLPFLKNKTKSVSIDQLNSPLETPEQWDKCRNYEADLATSINHSKIKTFCREFREHYSKWVSIAPYLKPLYDYFVDDTITEGKCIAGLYEKMCYIRDRVWYRPSHVITSSKTFVQTSAEIRKEIESLPNAETLYQAATSIYNIILSECKSIRSMDNNNFYANWLFCLWYSVIRINETELSTLGYTPDQLHQLGQDDDEQPGSMVFLQYIAHLIEIENFDSVVLYNKK